MRRVGRLLWIAGLVAAIGAAAILSREVPAAREAWLLAFLLWSGLSIGCLGLVMGAHILGEAWLPAVRPELEAGARLIPLGGLMAVPLLLALPDLFVWAGATKPPDTTDLVPRLVYLDPLFFAARTIGYFAVWTALAFAVARPGEHAGLSAFGLVLLLPTVTFFAIDWVMARDPEWLSSLFGLIFAAGQLGAALAGAILAATLGGRGARGPSRSGLASALLTLLLTLVYLRFSQFLVVWAGNLPEEVVWYLARADWRFWAQLPLALAALLFLLLHRSRSVVPLLAAAALVLALHPIGLAWQLRPGIVAAETPAWADLLAVAGAGALWLSLFAHARRAARLA